MKLPERAGRPLPASGRPALVRARLVAALVVSFARAKDTTARTGAGAARAGAALRTAGSRRLVGAGAVAAGLALAGLGAAAVTDRPAAPAPTRVADVGELPATVHGAAPTAPEGGSDRAPVAPPARLRIPRIGVDTALGDLQVQDDGHLAAPADPDVAGWWSQGPAPGGPGTAVIVGHVDSRTGPAVFAGLSVLRPGDTIEVQAVDGTTSSFTVQALRSYDKQDFPAEQVFGNTAGPSLRLITCGGSYDRAQHAYDANLVVFAAPPARGNDTPTA